MEKEEMIQMVKETFPETKAPNQESNRRVLQRLYLGVIDELFEQDGDRKEMGPIEGETGEAELGSIESETVEAATEPSIFSKEYVGNKRRESRRSPRPKLLWNG